MELASYFSEKAAHCQQLAGKISDNRAAAALWAIARELETFAAEDTTHQLRKRTVVLVEDDDAFRYAASRHLTGAGFEVVSLRTTMDALLEVDSGRSIDAFVVDVAMPAGNPHGVSFALMMLRRRPGIPILLMTAFPDLLENYKLPGKVLFKPLDLDMLTGEIQALFSRPSVQ